MCDSKAEGIGADALQASHQGGRQQRRVEHHHLQLLLRALADEIPNKYNKRLNQEIFLISFINIIKSMSEILQSNMKIVEPTF